MTITMKLCPLRKTIRVAIASIRAILLRRAGNFLGVIVIQMSHRLKVAEHQTQLLVGDYLRHLADKAQRRVSEGPTVDHKIREHVI
jgi:hypothetical protein